MDRHGLQPGTRASIRTIAADGYHDVIGWIQETDDNGLLVAARDGLRRLSWAEIAITRTVGVARGRDPLKAPATDLDELAARAGLSGRRFVIRLSSLLDGQTPVHPEPSTVQVFGEWGVSGAVDVMPAAWAAAYADARSLLMVTTDEDLVARLLASGFSERD